MSYQWNKNDREIWKNNEVLQELEKRLIAVAFEMQRKIEDQKKVEAQMAGEISDKLKDVSQDATEANKNVADLLESAQDLAEDGEEPEITPEQHAAAKEALLEELREMVAQAVSKRDIKLAYKIERTIEELTLED